MKNSDQNGKKNGWLRLVFYLNALLLPLMWNFYEGRDMYLYMFKATTSNAQTVDNGSEHSADPRGDGPRPLPRRYVVFAGTRPEIIKTAPVVLALKQANMSVHLVFTGQHPDLATPLRKFWDIQFDTILDGVFRPQQTLPSLTGNLISQIETKIPPSPGSFKLEDDTNIASGDVWIVQGDTSTVFAASTVAFLRGTPLIHLEAGLRTHDMAAPFPEEFNRRSAALAASLHVAPTHRARQNLLHQGVDPDRVVVLGNSGMDATRLAQPHLEPPAVIQSYLNNTRLVLVTLHRRENVHQLPDLFNVMGQVPVHNVTFLVAVHPNPDVSRAATEACRLYPERIKCVPALGYSQTHWIMKYAATLVVTDSGGLQEEATWYGRAVLLCRTTTERPEGIEAGSTLLVPNAAVLQSTLVELLTPGESSAPQQKSSRLQAMEVPSYPYGKGYTSDLLVDLLQNSSTQALLAKPIRMVGPAAASIPTIDLFDNNTTSATTKEILDYQRHPVNVASKKELLPPCSQAAAWQECSTATDDDTDDTIDVVLTVFKRSSLTQQLDAAVQQSVLPGHIWIVQNEGHVYVPALVKTWRMRQGTNHSTIPVDIISSTANSRFHGRFHLAYAMSSATYISIWDDDVVPARNWLKFNMEFSKSHDDCLVGGNGRTFSQIVPERHCIQQDDNTGLVDFVGHSWTLRREFLRFYLGVQPLTYMTGEDIQLSAALAQHGIASYFPEQSGDNSLRDLPIASDKHASWLTTHQQPRHWLFCKLIEQGFQPTRCENCDPDTVAACLSNFSKYEDYPLMSSVPGRPRAFTCLLKGARRNNAPSPKAISSKTVDELHDDAKLRDLAAALVNQLEASSKSSTFDSNSYWEDRYAKGGNSGDGSYGELATYKAKVINEFVMNQSVQEVAEFGCGDGNNLKLYDKISQYFGYDVSTTAVKARQAEWANSEENRTFIHYSGKHTDVKRQYEAVMSLDVLYHLVAPDVFVSYLETIFFSASRYVLIYATDEDRANPGAHVAFRRFTPYIDARFKCWKLIKAYGRHNVPGSSATFFLYERRPNCVQLPAAVNNVL